ncbi:lamin tail domain-containing protein [Streptomyces sp. ME109]|uniref:lamin tail domain-containing protein n=1 Tax=Streptomyces sp. me109 TaxID=1827853 RepID=UPI002905CA18|nr:lamin tail domain-containing protein [Streptomyces sp. me109]
MAALPASADQGRLPFRAQVQISDVQYDSPGWDSGSNWSLNKEWVDVTNTGRYGVNLNGWTLEGRDGRAYEFHLRLGGRETVRVHTGVGRDTVRDVYQDRRTYAWDNRSDTATLRNDRDRVIDVVSWGRGLGRGHVLPGRHFGRGHILPGRHHNRGPVLPGRHHGRGHVLPIGPIGRGPVLPGRHNGRVNELPVGRGTGLPVGHVGRTNELPVGHVGRTNELPVGHVGRTNELPVGHVGRTNELPVGHVGRGNELPVGQLGRGQMLPGSHQGTFGRGSDRH